MGEGREGEGRGWTKLESGRERGARESRARGEGELGGMKWVTRWGGVGRLFMSHPRPPVGTPLKGTKFFAPPICHLRSLLFYPPLNFSNVNFLVFLFS